MRYLINLENLGVDQLLDLERHAKAMRLHKTGFKTRSPKWVLEVFNYYTLTARTIGSSSIRRDVDIRGALGWILYHYCTYTLNRVAKVIGRSDHCAVIDGNQKHFDRLKESSGQYNIIYNNILNIYNTHLNDTKIPTQLEYEIDENSNGTTED